MHVIRLICLIFVVATNASPLGTKYLPSLLDVGPAPFSVMKFSTAPNVADTINSLDPFSSLNTNSASFRSSNPAETSNFVHDRSYAASSNVLQSNSAPFGTLKFSTAPNVADNINSLGQFSSNNINSAPFSSTHLGRNPILDRDSSYAASPNVLNSNSAPFSTPKFSAAPNVADDISSSATFSTFNINLPPFNSYKPNKTPINKSNSTHAASSNIDKNNSTRFSTFKFSSAPNIIDVMNTSPISSSFNSNAAPSSSAKLETPIYEIDSRFSASSNVMKSNSTPKKATKFVFESDAITNRNSASSKNAAKSIRYTSIVNPAAQTTSSTSSITPPKPKNTHLPTVQNSAPLKLDKASTNERPYSYSAPLSVSKINSAQFLKTTQHPVSNSGYIRDYSATSKTIQPIPNDQQSYSATNVKFPQHSSGTTNIHTSFHHSPAYKTFSEPKNSKTTFVHTATAPIKSLTEKASSEYFEQASFAPSVVAATTNQIFSDLETVPGIKRFDSAEEGTRYAENGGYLYR